MSLRKICFILFLGLLALFLGYVYGSFAVFTFLGYLSSTAKEHLFERLFNLTLISLFSASLLTSMIYFAYRKELSDC